MPKVKFPKVKVPKIKLPKLRVIRMYDLKKGKGHGATAGIVPVTGATGTTTFVTETAGTGAATNEVNAAQVIAAAVVPPKAVLQGRELSEAELMKRAPDAVQVILAKERTMLSHERTVISLAQLSLGIVTLGFFIVRFFADDPRYEWFLLVGAGLIIVSGWLFYHTFKDYAHYQKKVQHLHERRGHLDMVYIEEISKTGEDVHV